MRAFGSDSLADYSAEIINPPIGWLICPINNEFRVDHLPHKQWLISVLISVYDIRRR